MKAVRDHQSDIRSFADADHRLAIVFVCRHRLFTENMHLRLGGSLGKLAMQRIWQNDEGSVHAFLRKGVFEIFVAEGRHTIFSREQTSLGRISGDQDRKIRSARMFERGKNRVPRQVSQPDHARTGFFSS